MRPISKELQRQLLADDLLLVPQAQDNRAVHIHPKDGHANTSQYSGAEMTNTASLCTQVGSGQANTSLREDDTQQWNLCGCCHHVWDYMSAARGAWEI